MSEKQNKGKKKSESAFIGLMAGSIAGGMEAITMWPTEYAKTQIQLQSNKGLYKGWVDCLVQNVKQKGFTSIYSGLTPVLIAAFPKAGVRFSSFETFKGMLENDQGQMSPFKNFVAGLGAGACEGILVVTPSETIKVKFMQLNTLNHNNKLTEDSKQLTNSNSKKGIFRGLSTIIQNEGIRGLYQGVVPTVLKQSSNQAIRFLTYNEIKAFFETRLKSFEKNPTNAEKTTWALQLRAVIPGISGSIAGVIGVLINNPIDTVKTRMQGFNTAQLYQNSSWVCFVSIFRNEGFLAYYKGVGPRLTRIIFGQAIIFTCYENVSTLLHQFWEDKK